MADPRDIGPQRRRDTRSDLMKAQSAALDGEKVNFCPFGCTSDELDEHGYCRHLIGFTNDKKNFEPMVRVKRGRRMVKVRKEGTGEYVQDFEEDDEGYQHMVREEVMKPVLEPVLPADKLVQITISYRVYRDAPRQTTVERTVEKVSA
jgi:hypothetical protein